MDKYAELRAALESATPGLWKASEHRWPEQVGCCPLVGRPYSICGMDRKNIAAATSFGTAVYIAAASPEAIRALLAERDALREALERAGAWVADVPHGDNCFVSNHYEGDPGNQCNCGADSIVEAIFDALAQEQGGSDARSQ